MVTKQYSTGIEGVGNETHFLQNKHKKADKESTDKHAKGELQSFVQDTTLHGARYLYDRNVFRRVLWTLALIGNLAFCIYQVHDALVAFKKRPFITKISTSSKSNEGGLLFPAVSICNLNSLNIRRYKNFLKSTNFSEAVIEKKIQDILLILNRHEDIFKDDFIKRNEGLFVREENANGTIKTLGMLSHQIGEMLLPSSSKFHSCSINGKKCSANNFTNHMSSAHGLCYTFNSPKSGQPLLLATSAGQNSGLKLFLNIERDSYVASTLSPTKGLAIIIHDQKSFPFMEEFGITLQPGISTLCAIKRRKIFNLEAPYETNCTNRSLGMFDHNDVYAYTKRACIIKCRNDYTIRRCGCTPPEFKADAPICAPNDTVLCVYNSYEEFGASSEKESCEKNCPEACEQIEYETSFSYSAVQTESIINHLMEFLNSNDTSVDRAIYEPLLYMTPSERERYTEKNIISLFIYFDDLSYEIIKQTPVYESWTLIGSLGGTFGLFLGMSLLTILEFLDFILTRICCLLQGLKTGNRHTGTIHAES